MGKNILFVSTETNEIPKYGESLAGLGHQVEVVRFIHRKIDGKFSTQPDAEILEKATALKPELIVYVGTCGGNMPTTALLQKLNQEIAPSVLICSDAADEPSPWWPLLHEYDREGCFTVMVAIDGNRNWPFAGKGITALTPVPPAYFAKGAKPHRDRARVFGYAGNIGGIRPDKVTGIIWGRGPLVREMMGFGLETRDRDLREDSYPEVADFMCESRITPNFAETGSFQRMHVKGRVVEAGLARCTLLETRGSPARDWFTPGVDYLEYETVEDARRHGELLKDQPDETERYGQRLHDRVMAEHAPDKFWGRIFDKAGLRQV